MKLSDQVYEKIFGLIVSGELPENSKLPTELELADRFAVSRTIVREALARLKDDGLVLSRQGSGNFVKRRPDEAVLNFAPLGSIADMQRCFEFRISLESEAAYFAAQRSDETTIGAIESALANLDKIIETGQLGVEADYDLHFAIAQAAQNRFFLSTMASLRNNICFGMNLARSLSLTRPVDRLRQVQAEHVAILDAIRDHDAERARDAMRLHLHNARTRVFEGSAQGGSSAGPESPGHAR